MPKIGSIKPRTTEELKSFWQTTDGKTVRLYQGDVIQVLKRLPSQSVQCVICSPPYWALRDYGTAQWEGGNDPKCTHAHENRGTVQYLDRNGKPGSNNTSWQGAKKHSTVKLGEHCKLCSAKRIDDSQLGSEQLHDCHGWASLNWCDECHVCRMTAVFREVRRVLRDDGTLWLNYGDTFSSGKCLPSGNLMGIPWRVSFALQADGWILRSDMPWVKRASMPEPVRNRPAKALEYVFMFVKKMGYYYDAEAVRKTAKCADKAGQSRGEYESKNDPTGKSCPEFLDGNSSEFRFPANRNFRNADLWFESVDGPHGMTGVGDEVVGIDVTSEAYSGAHFAAFGSRLITPFILAGTSAYGCCAKCAGPWERVLTKSQGRTVGKGSWCEEADMAASGSSRTPLKNSIDQSDYVPPVTLGWQPTCECHGKFVKHVVKVNKPKSIEGTDEDDTGRVRSIKTNRNGITGSLDGVPRETEEREEEVLVYESDLPLDQHPIKPCTVMDIFVGSGTTCAVSLTNGRYSVGIDLSEKYLKENAIPRIEGAALNRPALRHLVKKEVKVCSLGIPKPKK